MAPPYLPIAVQTCCGLIGLRAGSLTIAYIYLVLDIVMCTVVVTTEAVLSSVRTRIDASLHPLLPEVANTEAIMLGLWFLLVPLITALLVGLHKDRPYFVKIYLMGIFAYILLEVTVFFVSFFYTVDVLILTLRGLFVVIEVYFFIVVRSQYYKMVPHN